MSPKTHGIRAAGCVVTLARKGVARKAPEPAPEFPWWLPDRSQTGSTPFGRKQITTHFDA
jgi:hypothetical protein